MPSSLLPTPPLWKVFLLFIGPIVFGNLLQSLSGTLNGVYIGQLLGTNALAAAAIMFPIVFFFIAFIIGIGSGASVLIGQAWGARNLTQLKKVSAHALWLGGLFGLVVAVLAFTFATSILNLLNTPPSIFPDALIYMRTLMLTLPTLFVFILLTSLLRGVGDTGAPLRALLLTAAINALLTPALIIGWAGLPQLGITGAAIAGMLCNVAGIAWLTRRMHRVSFHGAVHPMALAWSDLNPKNLDKEILKAVARIGFPTSVQMVVISLAEIALLGFVNEFGSDATAAYGAANQIVNYVQFPAIAIGITCSILGSQAIGAAIIERKPVHDTLGKIVKTGIGINLLTTGGFVVLAYLLAHPAIRLFITDSAVVGISEKLLYVMLWSFLLMGTSGAMSGIMRASGDVLMPTAITIGGILAIQIPSAWLLKQHFGLTGVWLSYPITFGCILLCQASYYHWVWKHKPIKRLL